MKMPSIYGRAIARHALTLFGGFLIAAGWTHDAFIEAMLGGVSALIGLFWSLLEKHELLDKAKTPVTIEPKNKL